MGNVFLHGKGGAGGGSGGTELTVVGGTTRPAKANQNTIWINTDAEITSCVLSATEPTNPVDGMVWVTISNVGAIKMTSPVSDEWVTVYPISAKQYVGGEWVAKEAKVYQNGVWVDWVTWLYNHGNTFADITGGWVCRYNSGYASDVQNTSDGLYAKTISNSGAYVHNWYTEERVDVTKFTTLHAKCISTKENAYIRIGLLDNKTNTDNAMTFGHGSGVSMSIANTEVHLSYDISNISGEYHIKLNYQGGDSAEVWWTEVRME